MLLSYKSAPDLSVTFVILPKFSMLTLLLLCMHSASANNQVIFLLYLPRQVNVCSILAGTNVTVLKIH